MGSLTKRRLTRDEKNLNRWADEENRRWPTSLVAIDASRVDSMVSFRPFAAWRSRAFIVQGFKDVTDEGTFIRISVQRVEHASFRTDAVERPISWDELMECKRQVGYADSWAVEVFPPDEHIIDKARMRHLFIVDPSRLPFSWRKGRSGKSGIAAEQLLEVPR